MKNLLNEIVGLLKITFQKTIDDDIFTQGAAIAFYTIFSIAPLFILLISLSGIFFSDEQIIQQIDQTLGDYLDPSLIQSLNQFFIDRFQDNTGFIATIVALMTVLFGATTVITQLKSTLNRIWNVHDVKIHSVWNYLLNRALSVAMILLFSLLLLTSLLAEAVFAVVSQFFSDLFPGIEISLYQISIQFGTIGFAVLFFALIFKILPDVHARWTDIFIGATITTILFIIGKYLIGLYLYATGIDVTYKAAGSLVIFIIWVYYNIQTILIGAVITQVYTEKYGGKIIPYKYVSLKNFQPTEIEEI